LLANYNDGRFLRTALDAILSQTDPADEIILVDDGSSDDSSEIMLAAKSIHPNVRIIVHEQNLGQHHAIQRALLESKSDYIVWAAADDVLLPNFVECNRIALTKYPKAGLSFSRLAVFSDGCEIREFTHENHGVAFDLGNRIRHYLPEELVTILRKNYLWISGNTVVVRRNILLDMGGFLCDLKWHGDSFAYYSVALRHGIVSIPQTLAVMRERPLTYSRNGMTNDKLQKKVLCNIIKELKRPCNLDLLAIFCICPSLLSPFGKKMISVGLCRIQYWSIGIPLCLWYSKRRLSDIRGTRQKIMSVLSMFRSKFNKILLRN
jgi:glycosyltransferase involved in cell wall biosynthesis